jgi:DDE family transposase
MKRSVLVEGYGIPLGRIPAGAQRHDSPLLAPTLDLLGELGPLPEEITVHLDAGYDSGKTRQALADRGLRGQIAHKGEKAPIQASRRRADQCLAQRVQPVPTLLRAPREGDRRVLDLADAIITVRSLIRRAWITHRWDTRPARRRRRSTHQSARPLSHRARRLRLDMSAEMGRTSSECSASPTATSPFPANQLQLTGSAQLTAAPLIFPIINRSRMQSSEWTKSASHFATVICSLSRS